MTEPCLNYPISRYAKVIAVLRSLTDSDMIFGVTLFSVTSQMSISY